MGRHSFWKENRSIGQHKTHHVRLGIPSQPIPRFNVPIGGRATGGVHEAFDRHLLPGAERL